MVKNKKAFTLVELLAVIVILAVILVIAVPQIMNVITESRKGSLASSAKLIASSAETAYISNQTLGIEKNIRCEDVSNYNSNDDFTCDLQIEDGKAKVTLIGKGKFEGMAVCGGTKEEAEVEEPKGGKCPTPFEKDTWATIKAAVTARDTSKYNVGDTRTIYLDIDGNGTDETYTLRIANNSHYKKTGQCKNKKGTELASETACGFVIEFADVITKQKMNSNGSSVGGWKDSEMRTYVNGTIYNALPADLKSAIEPTTVVSGHENGKTENYKTEDKVYLLSTREVWGKEEKSNTVNYDSADGDTITRQLDYYINKNVSTSSFDGAKKQYSGANSAWWLRSASSYGTSAFYSVITDGDWYSGSANLTYGVSPTFRLG